MTAVDVYDKAAESCCVIFGTDYTFGGRRHLRKDAAPDENGKGIHLPIGAWAMVQRSASGHKNRS